MSENEESSSESSTNEVTIARRDTDRVGGLRTGSLATITVRSFRSQMVEMEDVNFHHDSAVLLPDFGDEAPEDGSEEQNRVTGLAVLYACYRHVREHPDQKLLIAGHTDRSGSDAYNVTLSELRGENILHALVGNREEWVAVCQQKYKVEDYQQILKWVSFNWGWDCDPGPVNNVQNAQTRQATENFQTRYNSEFSASIPENGYVGTETWGAFFDVYMRELVLIMGTTEAGLAEAQDSIQFVDELHPFVGCGENFPITSDYRSATDRRVELLFFDPGEEPEVVCLEPIGHCNTRTCEIYNSDIYDIEPVPVDPLPQPSGVEIVVTLKLIFKDPDEADRNFPQNFPVVVEFPDGSTQDEQVGEDGILVFRVRRDKNSFTLKFRFSEINYIASPPRSAASGQPEELITGSQVEDYHGRNHRIFSVPTDWGLEGSDWEVRGSPSYYTSPNFTGLRGISGNIGSDAAPVEVALDPHWQYLKFLYFDRFLKQKLSILPVMVDGFRDASSASGDPDTHSNWTTDPQACQCLPWILQDPAKPDRDILIQLRTEQHTFIESQSGGSRSIVSGTERNTPNMDRLKYYDLPQLWKSSNYFARLSGGSGAAPAEVGRFASTDGLAGMTTTDERPLMFYLDDMILTDASLSPISWTPDTNDENRVSIFCHAFDDTGPSSSDLSEIGLYKPDSSNKQSWFTQRPVNETTRNYIADYPDWTRLVITQGNIFDAFDKRTPDGSGDAVVGARAAIRHIDVFASSNTFIQPGTSRPLPPAPTRGDFCAVQPLSEQRHDRWWTTSSYTDHRGIGRFDMVLLRCCDVDGDFEIAVAISYLRYSFDYSPPVEDGSQPSNLTGNTARDYTENTVIRIADRWNAQDSQNSQPINIEPADTSTNKLRVRVLVFVQALPTSKAHYEVRVFRDIGAYADSEDGYVALKSNNPASNTSFSDGLGAGRLTVAHEAGHCISLGDDYAPKTSPSGMPGARLRSFDCYSPGSPYIRDDIAMMRSNRRVRARYAWHIAEWLHILGGNTENFVVKRRTYTYTLPHHSNMGSSYLERSHVNYPVRPDRNKAIGAHGRYDAFLYPLGEDRFSEHVLPNLTSTSDPFDGIISVIVKMKFDFDISNNTTIHNWLTRVDSSINRRFNFKYYAEGSFGGRDYDRCLLFFSPRYWVDGYSRENPRDTSEHIEVEVENSGSSEWDSAYELHFRRSHSANSFSIFFGNMIGLADGTSTTASHYNHIVAGVMPGGSVRTL